MLCYTILFYTMLWYTILYYTIPYYINTLRVSHQPGPAALAYQQCRFRRRGLRFNVHVHVYVALTLQFWGPRETKTVSN